MVDSELVIDGKIMNYQETFKDALHVLDSTELDAVYVEGTLFTDRR